MRLSTKGPRSLTRTSVVRWLLRFSTISHVLKGSVWCAAVISIMSYTSPLAAAAVVRVSVPGREPCLFVADASSRRGRRDHDARSCASRQQDDGDCNPGKSEAPHYGQR